MRFLARCGRANVNSTARRSLSTLAEHARSLVAAVPHDASISALSEFLQRHRRITVLTGAGVSTDSGIPDYRSPGKPASTQPMTIAKFMASPSNRQRYWARSFLGYPTVFRAEPNAAHYALAELEHTHGKVHAVITQNVDSLHFKAGSRSVIELHGRLSEVVCLGCSTRTSRTALQHQLLDLNSGFIQAVRQRFGSRFDQAFLRPGDAASVPAPTATATSEPSRPPDTTQSEDFDSIATGQSRPDGDVAVDQTEGFVVPDCSRCGGTLKPHVVFFGENVPAATVDEAMQKVDESDALWCLGTSLHVWSGRRFVDAARSHGKPVAILNRGPTASDSVVDLKIDASISHVFSQLFNNKAT